MTALDEDLWCGPALPILGLVSGFATRNREARRLAMLQAFVDDSSNSSGDGSVMVMAGLIADARNWARFSQEWSDYLGLRPRIAYFKMSEAASLSGEFSGWLPEVRDERVRLLNSVVLNHASAVFSHALPVKVYHEVFEGYSRKKSAEVFLLYSLISTIVKQQHEMGFTDPIDFIFDNSNSKKSVLGYWSEFEGHISSEDWPLGSVPIFRDDKTTLPLQAADMAAWWARQRFLEKLDPSLGRKQIPKSTTENRSLPMFTSEHTKSSLQTHRILLALDGFS